MLTLGSHGVMGSVTSNIESDGADSTKCHVRIFTHYVTEKIILKMILPLNATAQTLDSVHGLNQQIKLPTPSDT